MPWSSLDAPRHTREARTRELRQLWARVANEALERTHDEGLAIREANAAVSKARTRRRLRVV